LIYPAIFKRRCCCGGELCYRTTDNVYLDEYDSGSEVVSIKCRSCGKTYSIRWDPRSGEPYPILDKDGELSKFRSVYTQ
jgi:hypothetical protein